MNHNAGCDVEAMQECKIREEEAHQLTSKEIGYEVEKENVHQPTSEEIMSFNAGYEATSDKNLLKEITSDSIIVPPVKRCIKCVGCKSCKKIHLPDQARPLDQQEIVKKTLSFNGARYTAPQATLTISI